MYYHKALKSPITKHVVHKEKVSYESSDRSIFPKLLKCVDKNMNKEYWKFVSRQINYNIDKLER